MQRSHHSITIEGASNGGWEIPVRRWLSEEKRRAGHGGDLIPHGLAEIRVKPYACSAPFAVTVILRHGDLSSPVLQNFFIDSLKLAADSFEIHRTLF